MAKPIRALLAMAGGVALFLWALSVVLGTGIGYDHPIVGLFDGGFISSLWRLSKAGLLGVMAWATVNVGASELDRKP